MNNERLQGTIGRIVREQCGDALVSLYVIGSFQSHEMIPSSDIDLVGVMNPGFDFSTEAQVNRALNRRIRSTHRIDLGTMSIRELSGGSAKGSLMKHIELPIFLNFLKRARLIYGKRINFDRLPIKPASPKEGLRYHIKVFDEYKMGFREKNRVRSDFSFRDFLKIVFYIANLELQLERDLPARVGYTQIDKAFRSDKEHIVHQSMRLRRKRSIRRKERQAWLDSAEIYVAQMRSIIA